MDQNTAVAKAMARISAESTIPDTVKQDLVMTLGMAGSPLQTDPWIYRRVVASLGFAVIATVLGGLWLAGSSGADVPEGIIALGSAAVGALAGLLAPSPVTRQTS